MSNLHPSNWVELLRYRALRQPNQTAFTYLPDGDALPSTLTYQALDLKARAIAAYLRDVAPPGGRVLLLYPPGLEYIAGFFGCLYGGVIAVPLYPPRKNRNLSRIESILADSQATIALMTSQVLKKVEQQFSDASNLSKLHCLATDNLGDDLAEDWQEEARDGDTIAYLQYTSGSTATPKGVMITHETALSNSADMALAWETGPDSLLVSWLPHFHDFGQVYGVFQSIYKGFPGILMSPTSFIQQPIRWLKAISDYRATHSGGPNFAYAHCVDKITPEQRSSLDLSSWEVAVNGAEPIRDKTLKEFYEMFAPHGFRWDVFCPGYGLAEATLKVTAAKKGEKPILGNFDANSLSKHQIVEAAAGKPHTKTLVGCGKTLLDTKIVIVDSQSLKPSSPGWVGEIWVSGSSVARGYWNRYEETQHTFQAYLAETKEGPFLRTGDLGFVKDGELFVTGRLKDLIIIRGINHYPQDLELTVEKSHPSLRLGFGAAFAIEDKEQERLVIAYEIERNYSSKGDLDEVIVAIRQALSEKHELEVSTILLLKTGSIPKTSSGKIQRQKCRHQFLNNQLNVVFQWQEQLTDSLLSDQYSDNIEKKSELADSIPSQIKNWLVSWIAKQKKLTVTDIHFHQPINYYGLSSLDTFNLHGDLEAWLLCCVTPDWLWDSVSIESLAYQLSELVENRWVDDKLATSGFISGEQLESVLIRDN